MGANVFANGREVSAKKNDNQSIAAMPDVCLSPPTPPAGPVPIPYPNFSRASDTSNGTKTVKIKGQEAGIADISNYSKSNGDEAATQTLGMGTVTHCIQGKTKFAAWSFDVKFEGENVVRQMDMTTHNHFNNPNSASTTVSVAKEKPAIPKDPDCETLQSANEEDRKKIENDPKLSKTAKDALAGQGSTIANGKFTGPNGTTFIKGSNRNESAGIENANFSPGADNELREKKKSNLCPEAEFQYSGQDKRSSGHAESRIVEQILSADPKPTSGTILVNVSLRKTTNKLGEKVISKQPCGHCHRLLCAAKKCGINVYICDTNEQQQDLTDEMCQEDSNEPIKRSKRKRLIETIDASKRTKSG